MASKHADRAVALVTEFFKGDERKTELWFGTPNPMLGGAVPGEMITRGRSEKLLKFIEACIEEPTPPGQEEQEKS